MQQQQKKSLRPRHRLSRIKHENEQGDDTVRKDGDESKFLLGMKSCAKAVQ